MSVNAVLIKDRMLDRLAKSDAHFKSQQHNESDLTTEEKRQIAESLLDRNVSLFLQRFHRYLLPDDLLYFDDQKDSYEVNFYLEEIRKENNANKKKIRIKNRRYSALQRLIKEGEYFSDVHMRQRMPYLYEQMIGQYQTEEEKKQVFPECETTFSGFLMNALDKEEERKTKDNQMDAEEAADEEFDSDTSDEEVESEKSDLEGTLSGIGTISGEEKEKFRHEFRTIMFEQFLSGKDNYDYNVYITDYSFQRHISSQRSQRVFLWFSRILQFSTLSLCFIPSLYIFNLHRACFVPIIQVISSVFLCTSTSSDHRHCARFCVSCELV